MPGLRREGAGRPGQRLTDADVVRVDVLLGDGAARLPARRPADRRPTRGSLRDLRPGELIPVSGSAATAVSVQQVALLVDATSASALTAGSVVDVYVNRPEEGTTVGPAHVRRARARPRGGVRRARRGDDGVLGGAAETRAVHVMVPREAVRDLVADVDLGRGSPLVPVPGGVAAAAS